MISLPFRRSPRDPKIDALYGMIVAQARSPSFYLEYGVSDTVTGRLDMIVLHLVLVLRQLAPAAEPAAGQRLFDRFCQDIDDNFREMGVGDLSVPKQMRRVAEVFYGRAKAYEAALAADGADALVAALARNVFGVSEPALGARRLAAYMQEADRRFRNHKSSAGALAEVGFPDPSAVPSPPAKVQQ
jgi:cytochrome b pre-mRNA-processing protein 3